MQGQGKCLQTFLNCSSKMYWCKLETATEREETNVLLAKHHKLETTKDKLESFTVGRCVIEDETITRKISAVYTI